MTPPWLDELTKLVQSKPLVILRFDEDDWERLLDSRRGVNQFTIARAHRQLDGVKVPAPCLIFGEDEAAGDLYFGLITSKGPIATLDSRIKVKRAVQIQPGGATLLASLVTAKPYAANLRQALKGTASIIPLSPKLGSHLIERLASIERNSGPLRAVVEALSRPKRYQGNAALQDDAVRSAIAALGAGSETGAISLELVSGRETALSRVSVMEDAVVQHDARNVPGYALVGSDMTGRAVFEFRGERLEVFTANRLPLERCFGVDLIYWNATKQNVVMLQYKMLELIQGGAEVSDWIYRPDDQLEAEIRRMQKFTKTHAPAPYEYRLNPGVFYLKFVKRNGSTSDGGILMPLDHFEEVRKDPTCVGPKGGLRISYNSLAGRYMRRNAFLDLLRAGYIGAHAQTTRHLKTLIDGVLTGDRALIAAIQNTVAVDDIEDQDEDE